MNKEYVSLYIYSSAEAERNNEFFRWKHSHRDNIACKEAIEQEIRDGFDGHYLDPDCASRIIEEFGFQRTRWVLSNTLQHKDYDGRFHPDNRTWAKDLFLPDDPANRDFVVDSHPAVLNGFVDSFRNAYDQLQLLDQTHCEPLTGRDLEDTILVLSPEHIDEEDWNQEFQLYYAHDGFGCSPTARGRSIRSTRLSDGKNLRWDRQDFIGSVKDEYLPDWARQQTEKLRRGEQITSIHHAPQMEDMSL